MAIDRKARFTIMSADEIQTSERVSIPKNLVPIIDEAPDDDQELGRYLKDLLDDETITIDEVNFLIDSGVLAGD